MKHINNIVFGEYKFFVYGRPASIQSNSNIKNQYISSIKNKIRECSNIFVREIYVYIEWHTNFEERYETDSSYDIDNIIKPTLDAMTGKNGLFIDDCQVQRVECCWINKNPGTEDKVEITVCSLERNNDYVINKKDVYFFQKDGPIYYLIPNISKSYIKKIYKLYSFIISTTEYLKKYNNNFSHELLNKFENYLTPYILVKYHISRINKSGFPCIKKENINKFIESL